MTKAEEVLHGLSTRIREQERRAPVKLTEFMSYTRDYPERVFRSVFQRMYDMVISSVRKGMDEYPGRPRVDPVRII